MCFFSKIPKAYSCSFEIDKQVKAQSFAFLALHKKKFSIKNFFSKCDQNPK